MFRLVLFLSCIFAFCTACSTEEVQKPTNILLIMVDDLGSADLACYGSTDIQTPNIDQLAENGIKCTQAYSGCTVCAPARSTLMTGQHMGHTPVRGNTGGIALPDSAFTMAEFFKASGYATGGFGKWGLGEINSEGAPEQQGFDRFFGYYHQIHAHSYYPEYLIDNSQKVPLPAKANDPASYTQYLIFEEMKKFLQDHKDQAFFCYAPWAVPHGKFEIPDTEPALKLYQDKDWDDKRKVYAAMVSLLDKQLGETIALLKELEIYENTLIVFCSDNGGYNAFADYKTNGDLRGFKRDLYEGGIRVPMIASWPGKIPAASTLKAPLYFPDLLPTFAEAIGKKQELPRNIDGNSMLKAWKNPNTALKNRFLYWEYPPYDWSQQKYTENGLQQALRYDKWKMIRNSTQIRNGSYMT